MEAIVYPAVFHENEDGSYTVTFPDLPGCVTEGKTVEEAVIMAEDAMQGWIDVAIGTGYVVQKPSRISDVKAGDGEFVSLVKANVKDTRAVRRTISLPKWMDDKASKRGISLSRVLQQALEEKLNA